MADRALFNSASFRDSQPTREMPAGWKSPFRQEMYQLVVQRTKGGQPCFFGPAMGKDAIGQFRDAIVKQIALGNEKDIAEPTIIRVPSLRN
jgi:hypothetical protein